MKETRKKNIVIDPKHVSKNCSLTSLAKSRSHL